MSLNKNIKIDLHIHSIASKYKEDENIVKDSTVENLDVLFNKLKEHNITLFSITDHNRFDAELYKTIKLKMKEEINKNLNFIPGIEFDVELEEFPGSHKGQINVYFDASTDEDFDHIQNIVEGKYLKTKDCDFYKAHEFEMLLKDLNFNVILIASQTESIDKPPCNKSSLSFHTQNPRKYLKSGYINALEFQKPQVEGILKNDLKDISENDIALIMFSDCHEWQFYPKHDRKVPNQEKFFTEMKALPNFKGLLLAITSPSTRLTRIESGHLNFIEKISINNVDVPLDKSINVIIGNNGSGKSAIFSILSAVSNTARYKQILKSNEIKISDIDKKKKKYPIAQNEIIDKHFNSKKLFEFPYKNDDTEFDNKIFSYTSNVLNLINENINLNLKKNNIINTSISIEKEVKPYYPILISDFKNLYNGKYNIIIKAISQIKNSINDLKNDLIFKNDLEDAYALKIIEDNIKKLDKKYATLQKILDNKANVINQIKNIFNTLENKEKTMSSAEKTYKKYLKKRNKLISELESYIEFQDKKSEKPVFPNNVDSIETIDEYGFVFKNIPNYSKENFEENLFFESVFNQKISNLEDLQKIITTDIFNENLTKNKSSGKDNQVIFNANVAVFKEWAKKRNQVILKNDDRLSIGSTPGELATAYISYILSKYSDSPEIIMLDQPEDNISNWNLAKEIIEKIRSTRDEKQYIIVTHNPLLVVNLDADNIIYLENVNKEIIVKSGCLEYEDSETNIINIIIDKMEGGLSSIKKRLEMYKHEQNRY